MGANVKALKSRIRSVDSTLHLTRAMGLVASSKMRRAGEAMTRSREYANAFSEAMALLAASPECARSPYMAEPSGERVRLVVIAGDRGMAGGYNANVFRLAKEYPDAEFLPIGKRACDRFGQGYQSAEHFSRMDAAQLAKELCAQFCAGEFDRLGILSTKYVSMMSQEAQVQWILPLQRPEGARPAGVLFEPDERTVLEAVVPDYVAGRLVQAVRESFACEVAARRTAMDSAGKNAQVMIDDLQLQYNRARQNAITQEITEIVAGSGS